MRARILTFIGLGHGRVQLLRVVVETHDALLLRVAHKVVSKHELADRQLACLYHVVARCGYLMTMSIRWCVLAFVLVYLAGEAKSVFAGLQSL